MGHDERDDRWHDELSGRAAALAPARDVPNLSLEELRSLATLAMGGSRAHDAKSSGPRAWSRRRLAYSSLGAVVGSGVLVVAAILAIEPAAPSRPALGLPATTTVPVRSLPVLKVRSGPGTGGYVGGIESNSLVKYKFVAGPRLSSRSGSATAYVLASPTDFAAATGTIATALGLPDTVTSLGPQNYNGGSATGPDVTVDSVGGILNWLYPTWSGNVNTDPALANGSPSIAVDPGAPLPTDDQATADAVQLLQAAGISEDELGAPTVSRYEAGVNVSFQFVAGGLETDQAVQVEYGPGSTVLAASGVVATATASTTYPTISPAQAVGLLIDDAGPVPGESSRPTVTVEIDKAVLALATYTLADGRSYLLPTWNLSGTEGGSTGAAHSTYTGSVLAVPTKYVQFESDR